MNGLCSVVEIGINVKNISRFAESTRAIMQIQAFCILQFCSISFLYISQRREENESLLQNYTN